MRHRRRVEPSPHPPDPATRPGARRARRRAGRPRRRRRRRRRPLPARRHAAARDARASSRWPTTGSSSASITGRLDQLDAYAAEIDAALAAAGADADADELERASVALIELRDVLWQLRRDRLRTANAVADLAGRDAGSAALAGYLSIQQALSAIDRMEVRGRDSAGVHVLVWDHELAATDPDVAAALARRVRRRPVPVGCGAADRPVAVDRVQGGGRDRRARRQHPGAAGPDQAGHAPAPGAAAPSEPQVAVLGHTRWASVGIISEPNAHPVNSEELEQRGGEVAPYVVGVLNGDVDNHADLKVAHGLRIAGPITTDAKVIPALMARHADRRPGRGDRPVRGVPSHGGLVRGLGGHRGRRPPTTRAGCCSRCRAAARASTSGSPTTATSSPASRTASSRRPTATCAWTASTVAR